MISRAVATILTITIVCTIGALGAKWDYNVGTAIGPEKWHTIKGYESCSKYRQSPIEIVTAETKYSKLLTAFDLASYSDRTHSDNKTYKLSNNGHSVVIDLDVGDYLVSGGNLPGTYRAAQFHFHWGSDNEKGSEHVLDGKRYPMEMHIVHYDTRYASLGDAVDKPHSLAVLGWFFEVTDTDNTGYKFIKDFYQNITYAGSEVQVPAFPLSDLIPKIPTGSTFSHYYRYDGSLTTPPCHESVYWTVFEETVKISRGQQDTLRQMLLTKKGEAKKFMFDNHRPVQPTRLRTVFHSDEHKHTAGASTLSITLPLFLLPILRCIL